VKIKMYFIFQQSSRTPSNLSTDPLVVCDPRLRKAVYREVDVKVDQAPTISFYVSSGDA
jgi:hypothetical protein